MRKIEELLDHAKTYNVAQKVKKPFVVNPDMVMIGGEKYVKIDKALELIKERHIKNYVQYDNGQLDGWEDAIDHLEDLFESLKDDKK